MASMNILDYNSLEYILTMCSANDIKNLLIAVSTVGDLVETRQYIRDIYEQKNRLMKTCKSVRLGLTFRCHSWESFSQVSKEHPSIVMYQKICRAIFMYRWEIVRTASYESNYQHFHTTQIRFIEPPKNIAVLAQSIEAIVSKYNCTVKSTKPEDKYILIYNSEPVYIAMSPREMIGRKVSKNSQDGCVAIHC